MIMFFRIALIFIILSYIFPLILCIDHRRQKSESEHLFLSVDQDEDGIIAFNEIADYLEKIGGEELDTSHEIHNSILNAFENMGDEPYIRDVGPDPTGLIPVREKSDHLSFDEVLSYWNSVGNLMSVDEVANWIVHSVQLPVYEEIFRKNSITGFDFPALLESYDDGTNILEHDMNIISKLHRTQIRRSIRMKLFGVSDEPPVPIDPKCQITSCSVTFSWKAPPIYTVGKKAARVVPIHKYRAQIRRFFPQAGSETISLGQEGVWEEWRDMEMESSLVAIEKDHVSPHSLFEVRVQSWNIVGHSPWTEYIQCVAPAYLPGNPDCSDKDKDGNDNDIISNSNSSISEENRNSNHSISSKSSWSIMSIMQFIIDTYHAISVFIQFVVAISATISLGYFGIQQYYSSKPNTNIKLNNNNNGRRSSIGEISTNALISNLAARSSSASSSNLTSDIKNHSQQQNKEEDYDLSICNVCKKKLGWKENKVGWRYKHICHLCHRAFCQKHGISPHVRGMPCGVPGRCICNKCLTGQSREAQMKLLNALEGNQLR